MASREDCLCVNRVQGVNAEPQMSYVISRRCKALGGTGGGLRSKVTKSLHKLSHVPKGTECIGESRGAAIVS